MQKKFISFPAIFIILSITSCSSKKIDSYQSWEGKYFYGEEPIKAIAGYSMVMEWELKIDKVNDKYSAIWRSMVSKPILIFKVK